MMRATGVVKMTELQAWDYGFQCEEKVSGVAETRLLIWDFLFNPLRRARVEGTVEVIPK